MRASAAAPRLRASDCQIRLTDRVPCAMVPPMGVVAANAGSTCRGLKSSVSSA